MRHQAVAAFTAVGAVPITRKLPPPARHPGELTALDLGLVLERLAQVDLEVTGLRTGSLDGQR
jgi:hypothetical protein